MNEENIEDLSEEEVENEQERIVKMFKKIENEYPVIDIIQELESNGYQNSGEIILDTINDDLLHVSSIDDDGTVNLKLGSKGKDKWKEYNIEYKDKNQKIQWKCSMCGYQFEGGTSPPDSCPGCK